jgi:anthranilate phosphoribosyltransferase
LIRDFLPKVLSGENLTQNEAFAAMESIMEGKASQAQIGAFLIAMRMKGETSEEIAGFALSMRRKANRVETNGLENAVDLVGTGGDGKHTFNISTVASFVAAGAGIPVAKHGNRSVSSKCGSADVLQVLGINIELDAEQLSECLQETGIAFLFAPKLHPAMKHAVAPRKEIGIRTFFNMLGPITNPAGVKRQLIGVYDVEVARLLADVLKILGAKHVLHVHSEDGLDEISLAAKTSIIELKDGQIREYQVDATNFGFQYSNNGVVGGTAEDNALIALKILRGEKCSERDVVILNAAAGIYVSGETSDFKTAAQMAQRSLDSSAALERLEAMKHFTQKFN